MGALKISDAEFDSLIHQQRKTAAVLFGASWSSSSRAFLPIFEQVANENGHRLAFYTVDVDSASAAVAKYNIKSVPTTLLFTNGSLSGQLIGAVAKSQLSSFVGGV